MNSKPIFHIFGVPDGFDILNGTPDITPYFQRYYNGSEENTKYSIHRDNKGNITYAYLKYNLSSYQSRTGSFFGMSLTFSNEYCTDPVKLYELLDFVYVNKVLGSSAEKGLLQKIEVESKIQARYLIPNFGSAKDYIQQEIEFVLLNNITKLFANSFQPISVLFKNDQSHLVAQIPFADANNEKIISLLHTYNRIAISPNWEQEREEDPTTPVTLPKIVIAPETIKLYDEYVKNYQSYLIESLANVKAANINDARQGKAEIESVLKNLQSGTSTDQRLPQLISDYKALSGQFAELIQKIADEQNRRPTTPPRKPSPSTKHPIPWWKRYLPYISGVAVLVIFVVVLSNIFKKEDTGKTNPTQTDILPHKPNHIALARKALNEEDFEGALKELKNEDNCTQYRLYDSIYDQWIASLLNDQEWWNGAWQVAEKIEKDGLKGEKQSEIKKNCQDHFAKKVNSANRSNAKRIKQQIEELKFNYNKRNEHINQLENIFNPPQKTDTGGTGNTGSTTNTPSTNNNQKYKIKAYFASRSNTLPDRKLVDMTWEDERENIQISGNLPRYVNFYIVTESDDICTEKEKFFNTENSHLQAKKLQQSGWYQIEITEKNINKTFLFEGCGNTIEVQFITQ